MARPPCCWTWQHPSTFSGTCSVTGPREWRAYKAPKLAKAALDTEDCLDEPDVDRRARAPRPRAQVVKKGQGLTSSGARFRWPTQAVSEGFRRPARSVPGAPTDRRRYAAVAEIDETKSELRSGLGRTSRRAGGATQRRRPRRLGRSSPKPAALQALGRGACSATRDHGPPNPASLSLVRREHPRFIPGGGPNGGPFSDDLTAMWDGSRELDGSYVSIQGPPGTGKTHWGAQFVHSLISAGRRVGITAMSHDAIENLLEKILDSLPRGGRAAQLKAVRRAPDGPNKHPVSGTAKTNAPARRASSTSSRGRPGFRRTDMRTLRSTC